MRESRGSKQIWKRGAVWLLCLCCGAIGLFLRLLTLGTLLGELLLYQTQLLALELKSVLIVPLDLLNVSGPSSFIKPSATIIIVYSFALL